MLTPDPELILIVDDTPANLDVISDTLTDAGFEVAIAPSGERMFKQLQFQIPDLILLDVRMPVMDGFEVCRRLKNNALTADIPIIFMTALSDTESKTRGFDLGATDYITKPFQEAEVLARVKTHLHLRRLTKHLGHQVTQRTVALTQALKELHLSQRQLVQSNAQLQAGERKYRAVFNQTFQFTALLSLTGDLLEANQAWLDFGGLTLEEVIERPFWKTPWWQLDTTAQSRLQAAIATAAQSTFVRYEVEIAGAGSRVATIDFSLRPLTDADGHVLFLIAEGHDISERKAAAEQLKRQAQKLAQANSQLEDYSQTLEQKVEERTQALSQALANLQATQEDLIHAEKMAVLGQLTASVAHEINTPLGVIRGATTNMEASLNTILYHLPNLIHQLSAEQQATFLSLVEAALTPKPTLSTKAERQLRRQIQADLDTQGVSHADQLATQLILLRIDTNLQSYHSILNVPNSREILQVAYQLVQHYHSTRNIQHEVDRAAKIVFALTSYNHESLTPDHQLLPITASLEIALTLFHHRLHQGIEVIYDYSPNLPDIWCDPDELTQVWINLIDNAFDAMGAEGTLEIVVTQTADHLVVSITDSGGGIPPDIQAQIFEPFFTTKPRGEGSGLGLDIVRQIIQRHDGSIRVDSQPHRTTFTICLPVPPP